MSFARRAVPLLVLLCASAPGIAGAACMGGAPNGTQNPGEACDDGNLSQTDGCLNDCTVPFCGDTHVRAGVEVCDDGNVDDCDACRNDCQGTITGCGDGFICAPEQCDP